MGKSATLFLLGVLLLIIGQQSRAQVLNYDTLTTQTNKTASVNISNSKSHKGTFFITPFYQYCSSGNLELASLSGKFTFPDKTVLNDFGEEEISDYNNNYGSAYTYSMTALRIGYQLTEGLGISVYGGVKHFNFESWIAEGNNHSMVSDYPSFTTGISADYLLKIKHSLYAIGLFSYNFTTSRSISVNSNISEEVVKSRVKSSFCEANLALAYKTGRFTPYLGMGYTLQLVHPVYSEQYTTSDSDENPINVDVEFDSHFRGDAIYGFAGVDFLISKKITLFARSTFFEFSRQSLGFKLTI